MTRNPRPKNIDGVRSVPTPAQALAPISDEADISTSEQAPPPAPEPAPSPQPAPGKPAGPSKKRRVLIGLGVVAGVLVLGGGVAAWQLLNRTEPAPIAVKPRTSPSPTPAPTPVLVANPLTGVLVEPAAAQRPMVGVIIENLYPDARPQSGLGQAGVVYEALAEGGITRFLAVFQMPLPISMGPVRSLRPYYLDWGLEYDIPVAHAGGSQPALAAIKPLGMKDINALAYGSNYFFRTTDRYAPHNLYTSDTKLAKLMEVLGFNQAPGFQPLARKDDTPMSAPAHPVVKIPFSTNAYNAEYRYNAAGNNYLRFEGGAAQTDRNTGKQIEVKNLVVEFVPVTYGTQANGKPETDYHLIGTGKALVFLDGNVIIGTWSKSSHKAQTQLLDQSGAPIKLNRGNTWYSVVPAGTGVTY